MGGGGVIYEFYMMYICNFQKETNEMIFEVFYF